jgi:5-methylcytosine-specific restriction enzyme A
MNKLISIFLPIVLVVTLAIAVFAGERSGQWDKVRATHLKIEPVCQWCGQADIKKLEVHHVIPVHKNPALELDPDNLITLCRFCHFVVGHNCNWEKDNLSVRRECARHNK